MNKIFINIILLIICGFSLNKNLRLLQEPAKLDNLLTMITKIYNNNIKGYISGNENFTLSYFKEVESKGNVTLFLGIKPNSINTTIKKCLMKMGISDSYNNFIKDVYGYFSRIQDDIEEQNELKWFSNFLGSTKSNKKNMIGYGNLLIIRKGYTFDIILVYGFAKNVIPCLGEKGQYETSICHDVSRGYRYTGGFMSYSYDQCSRSEGNIVMQFLEFVSYKILGNKYGLNLAYPKFSK